jgi:acyl-CoA oxidase
MLSSPAVTVYAAAPPSPAPSAATAPHGAASLAAFLDGEHAELKAAVRARISRRDFAHRYDLDRTEHRELIWQRCQELAKMGWGGEVFPDAQGRSDVPRFLAIFETLGSYDANLVIKFGLQFGLFGGAIFYLGSKRHHDEYLPAVAALELVGCYAMTEIGHGSDTHRLQTVARYDAATEEFVIDTPVPAARKQFIGNAAMHARMAVVFAQLEVGQERHGVFGFLVPVRDERGALLPGVQIGDTGPKLGLLGIDNGWLSFAQVRVPRANLLDRFGYVTADGQYQARGKNPTMLVQRAMSGGRIAIAWAALSAAKAGLTIAIHYGARRRQFGAGEERLLLDYPLHRRRLLPRLAVAYAMDAALKHITELSRATSAMTDPHFEELTALFKAYSTWNTLDTLQECREACGGQGYLARNRVGLMRADIDPMTTLEGDNSLLYLFAAKTSLKRLRDATVRRGKLGPVLAWSELAKARAALMLALRRSGEGFWRDTTGLLRLLSFREDALRLAVARQLRAATRHGQEPTGDYQTPLLELAQASAERIALEESTRRAAHAPADVRGALASLAVLYALECVSRHAAWYLQTYVLTGGDARRLEHELTERCRALAPVATMLVDGFAIPAECLGELHAQREHELAAPATTPAAEA